jgi:DNA-binding response OmpR family regulator
MKVLVVDDNKDMTAIIQTMMEKKNHRAINANDGETGYLACLQIKADKRCGYDPVFLKKNNRR